MIYSRILSTKQLRIVPKLGFLKKEGFYLAGGTALSLHLGHRTSVDFDFYTKKDFTPTKTIKRLENILPGLAINFQTKDSIGATIEDIGLSFFYYDYPLLAPVANFQGINLASIQDIAAMKLIAIVQRGTKRDFIDIYYLLTKYSLDQIISYAIKKYPGYQEMIILRALIYFEDAEKETGLRKIKIFNSDFSWEAAKEKIFQAVKKHQLAMIRKK
ncbi:nucleotidyl transferase AbiEii/AbiGii toxin family protein [Candidatus Gottesmanbacteria bacterium]|nr:nucleotidyl transferase AbiEii/AbiGii toxin family protein [Candidatus Gottesmanbacteria bacterium]